MNYRKAANELRALNKERADWWGKWMIYHIKRLNDAGESYIFHLPPGHYNLYETIPIPGNRTTCIQGAGNDKTSVAILHNGPVYTLTNMAIHGDAESSHVSDGYKASCNLLVRESTGYLQSGYITGMDPYPKWNDPKQRTLREQYLMKPNELEKG